MLTLCAKIKNSLSALLSGLGKRSRGNRKDCPYNTPPSGGIMMVSILLGFLITTLIEITGSTPGVPREDSPSPYAVWVNGPPVDPTWFPIGVWLQDPMDAKAYKAIGINLYVGLWEGPTYDQLNRLKLAKMPVICPQNEVGLQYKDEKIILAWLYKDEPDNAQPLPSGVGYGAPISPEQVCQDYMAMKTADASRPILVNLGQGVAWDGWWGRGDRTGHPEDYPRYVQGCDIVSYDIYPVAHTHPDVMGKLWMVAEGVKRLVAASTPPRITWNFIECSGGESGQKPTLQQMKAEIWMSIIHGSRGIVYFVHEWKPEFSTKALLIDPTLYQGVRNLNTQIHQLAPVINSPECPHTVTVVSTTPEVPIASLVKLYQNDHYLFTTSMRDGKTRGVFTLSAQFPQAGTVEVLGEGRELPLKEGIFTDDFEGYGVHLYRIVPKE
jgi:hypothetical protein